MTPETSASDKAYIDVLFGIQGRNWWFALALPPAVEAKVIVFLYMGGVTVMSSSRALISITPDDCPSSHSATLSVIEVAKREPLCNAVLLVRIGNSLEHSAVD